MVLAQTDMLEIISIIFCVMNSSYFLNVEAFVIFRSPVHFFGAY